MMSKLGQLLAGRRMTVAITANSLAAANRHGIVCMSVAMACLVGNDMMIKKVGESIPLPQLLVVRGLAAALLILAVLHLTSHKRALHKLTDRRVLLRSLIDAFGSILYLASLMHLPLANATAINLASPLMIAVLASVFLGERPGIGRWIAICAGFAGVLMIAQPTAAGFSGWSWVCLAATLGHAIRDLVTRHIHPSVPTLVVTLGNALVVTLVAALWASFSAWQPMSWKQLGAVGIAALLLSAGYLLIVQAMRSGDMSVVAPFRYVGLLTALLLGWMVWNDVPNVIASAGIALVMMAGIRLLHEQRIPRAGGKS
jgi:drug/metabolite transporter (DMT)-like permease